MSIKINTWLNRILWAGVGLFLLLLPFHLVIKKYLPEPLGTYWKEALLVILLLVATISAIQRRKWPSRNLFNISLIAYIGYILLQIVFTGFSEKAMWGAYISILYLPLVWLVPFVLAATPKRLNIYLAMFIGIGALVSIGGIVEFLLNRAFFPSQELFLRQGFSDVYIYATHIRRVYFSFDSPTAFANTLAIILPLSIAFTFSASPRWTRVLYAIASLLIVGCIIVTFSRGIWVVVALSLVAMFVLSGFFQRYWKRFLLVGVVGCVLLIGLGSLFAVLHPVQEPATRYVELPPSDYFLMVSKDTITPLKGADLLSGEIQMQDWNLTDPISLKKDDRQVIFAHPSSDAPYTIRYQVLVPPEGALGFAIALSPEVWNPEKGDGVTFGIFGKQIGQDQPVLLFSRYINPKINPSDRRWRNYIVDLSQWAGSKVELSFVTDSGPAKNWAYDWAGWADLQLIKTPAEVFQNNPTSNNNVLTHYVATVFNWSNDETNRDRLAAWSLAMGTWQNSMFWGKGLGSTGVAGLRVDPQNAIVTESQFLKSLVELGVPGLLLWLFVWFSIARMGFICWKDSTISSMHKLVLVGIIASLIAVFAEGIVYQNLEVKQVNAFFWAFVGILAFVFQSKK
jgi:hypothetical protein